MLIDTKRIEQARKARLLKKRELALLAEIHPTSYTNLLKGRSEEPFETLRKVCTCLGLEIGDVVKMEAADG